MASMYEAVLEWATDVCGSQPPLYADRMTREHANHVGALVLTLPPVTVGPEWQPNTLL